MQSTSATFLSQTSPLEKPHEADYREMPSNHSTEKGPWSWYFIRTLKRAHTPKQVWRIYEAGQGVSSPHKSSADL